MSLAVGARLGPYEIIEPIGAGGMGEVYRARDTRLQRYVAVKIVPAAVAADPSALARFEREAQAVAALSHPNILAIHDFGHDNGVSYAVMELLEGRSLADVIQSGPVPIRKAIDYATQIAKGLAAAHERGIVHRDLKPANVFVNADGRVTILDFGLARLEQPPPMHTGATTAPGTSPGMVLGTAGYMAPEQVRGQAVDHRTDIFAFGAVLYEMLSGRRAFAGATAADTMGAVLNSEPPELDLDGSSSAPALDRIIRHCLEKEPSHRFQSTRDLAFALDALSTRSAAGAAAAAEETASPRPRRGWVPVAAASLLAGVALTWLATAAWRPRDTSAAGREAPVVRFTMDVPVQGIPWVDVSPDGQSLAYGVAPGPSGPEIWTRRLRDPEATKVPGLTDVFGARWREDSRRLTTLRSGGFYSIEPASGVMTPQLQLPPDLQPPFRNYAFAGDEDVLIGSNDGIVRFRPGQAPIQVAQPDRTIYEWYAHPEWLPDRSRFMFVASRRGRDRQTLEVLVQALDGGMPVQVPLPQGISKVLVDPAGAIIYGLNGALLGQRFDFTTLKPLGEPVTIGTDVYMERPSGVLAADLNAGTLAFRSGGSVPVQFEWVDRMGRTVGTFGSPGVFINFDLSPDNTRIAVIRRPESGANTMWLLDDVRGTAALIVDPSTGTLSDPTWSPDGQRIAYRRGETTVTRGVFGGEERKVADGLGYPDSWSSDGRYLALGRPNGPLYELWAIRMDGSEAEIPLVQGTSLSDEARFSPDGRWVAYHADINGQPQIYAIPFPPTGETFQISSASGVQPRWRRDGRELFFLSLEGQLMSVEIPGGDPRKATVARPLFAAGVTPSINMDQFTPSADGQRFLIRRPLAGAEHQTIHVVLNWRQLLQ